MTFTTIILTQSPTVCVHNSKQIWTSSHITSQQNSTTINQSPTTLPNKVETTKESLLVKFQKF